MTRRLAFMLSCLLVACGSSRSLPDAPTAGGAAGAAAGVFSAAGSGGRAGSAGGAAGTTPPVSCSASAPPLDPPKLAPGVVGEPYLQVLTIAGASASQLGWAITRGKLPDGLSLVPTPETTTDRPLRATAELRGTPRTAGKFEFTLQVSLLVQPICAAAPAIRSYELVVAGDSDADAGTP